MRQTVSEIRRLGSLSSRSLDRSAALGNREAVTRDLQSDTLILCLVGVSLQIRDRPASQVDWRVE